jgi:choline kinase/ubiquinone/menaquinone biosynthesis C-methylase UbiE
LPIICHELTQLKHAGVTHVSVLVGFQGDKIREQVATMLPDIVDNNFKISYVQLENWHQGSALSLLNARSQITAKRFLLCMADHIFDPSLIARMANVNYGDRSDVCFCLMESDTNGMVGLPSTSTKIKLNKTDLDNINVKAISQDMDTSEADGVDAGIFALDQSAFDKLDALSKNHAYCTLCDLMQCYTEEQKLFPVETDGEMWFAIETKDSLSFAVETGLSKMGVVDTDSNWMSQGAFDPDGKPIKIMPSGRGRGTAVGGSTWSEFTVERWRSAVYINLGYFGELNTATTNFISDLAKQIKLRGERVSLVEVGCGTGEFLRPLCDHFRLTVGLDFNANFIEFCNEHLPAGREDKLKFVMGDATELNAVIKRTCPAHIWTDTKIVTCVGNTMGIIPVNLKKKVYQEMIKLAGPKGVMVVVFWNAKCFGDACQNFYHANPQLCGPFGGDSIDFDTTTLTTPAPTSYRSHWTGIEEARQLIRDLNLEEITVEERGKGVIVAARMTQEDAAALGEWTHEP